MSNTYRIVFTPNEWERFTRELNTFDPERERLASDFLHEYDGLVKAVSDGERSQITIPWIDEADFLSRFDMGSEEENPSVFRMECVDDIAILVKDTSSHYHALRGATELMAFPQLHSDYGENENRWLPSLSRSRRVENSLPEEDILLIA